MAHEEHFVYEANNEEEAEVAQIAALFEAEAAVRKHRMAQEQERSRPSALECVECGDSISEARRKAVPGVQFCIYCKERSERNV